MELSPLTAISPVDGRYRNTVASCDLYFSEYALIKYRLQVEIEYFIALCELPLPQLTDFRKSDFELIRDLYRIFSLADAQKIKDTEKVTNHDVKAVEYFLRLVLKTSGLADSRNSFILDLLLRISTTQLFLCHSGMLWKTFIILCWRELSADWQNWRENGRIFPCLHGRMGSLLHLPDLEKKFMFLLNDLNMQAGHLRKVPISAKFGGATGNFNAHAVAYPKIDWVGFANHFIEKLGLIRQQTTTQIEHYDNLAAAFDSLMRINTILIDLDRDFWTYISLEYFKQKIREGEVGSSVMPHKVNPIDFENSEGNLGIANALFGHLSAKLPISRLQRDLTDSTVLRNIGVPIAHTLLAFKSLLRGLDKVLINRTAMDSDLEDNWVVISEAIQTILRREGYPDPYEVLKQLTRTNKQVTKADLHFFIDTLSVSEQVKTELKAISPFNYTGL